MTRLDIQVTHEADTTVLHLVGDLVFGEECQSLGSAVRELIDQGKNRFILDLEQGKLGLR